MTTTAARVNIWWIFFKVSFPFMSRIVWREKTLIGRNMAWITGGEREKKREFVWELLRALVERIWFHFIILTLLKINEREPLFVNWLSSSLNHLAPIIKEKKTTQSFDVTLSCFYLDKHKNSSFLILWTAKVTHLPNRWNKRFCFFWIHQLANVFTSSSVHLWFPLSINHQACVGKKNDLALRWEKVVDANNDERSTSKRKRKCMAFGSKSIHLNRWKEKKTATFFTDLHSSSSDQMC